MADLDQKKPLFRQEVFLSKKNQNFGSVSINTPIRYQLLTGGYCLILVGIIVFFIVAEFSEKNTVTGYINTKLGTINVYPSKSGVIVHSNVQQGQVVKRGETLFVIDTSYEGLDNTRQPVMLQQLFKRKEGVEIEIQQKKKFLKSLEPLMLKKYLSASAYQQRSDELSALETNKNLIEMEIVKYQQESAYTVRSPITGTLSNVIFNVGQSVNSTKPLVKILPESEELIAEIFIPVKQAGFLEKDHQIILHYDAYPSARFGTYTTKIVEVSQSILTDEEEDKPIRIGQPYYKIIAKLDTQFVNFYGQKKKIQPGMTFTAVIIGNKRKIWQWVLDPLYSYYGGLSS